MAKYQENGNRASQSHHSYLQCCLSTSTIMRHLGFLQNDDTIMYSLESLISSSRGETDRGFLWSKISRLWEKASRQNLNSALTISFSNETIKSKFKVTLQYFCTVSTNWLIRMMKKFLSKFLYESKGRNWREESCRR